MASFRDSLTFPSRIVCHEAGYYSVFAQTEIIDKFTQVLYFPNLYIKKRQCALQSGAHNSGVLYIWKKIENRSSINSVPYNPVRLIVQKIQ